VQHTQGERVHVYSGGYPERNVFWKNGGKKGHREYTEKRQRIPSNTTTQATCIASSLPVVKCGANWLLGLGLYVHIRHLDYILSSFVHILEVQDHGRQRAMC